MVRQDQVGRLGSVCPAGKTGVLMKEAEVEEWRKRINYVVVIFVLFILLLLCLLFVFRFKSVVRYFIFPPLHDPVLCSWAPKAAFLCFISWCDVTVKEDGKSRRELWQFRSGKWQNGEHKRRVEILCFSLSLQAVFVLIKFLPYPFCVTAQVSDRDKGSILPVSKNYVFTIFFN